MEQATDSTLESFIIQKPQGWISEQQLAVFFVTLSIVAFIIVAILLICIHDFMDEKLDQFVRAYHYMVTFQHPRQQERPKVHHRVSIGVPDSTNFGQYLV